MRIALQIGIVFICLLLSGELLAAQKLALVIGNSQYDDSMGTLQNPLNDAQAIDNQLKNLGFKTILIKNANRIKMLEAIDDFSSQISLGDTVIFYYAGHGASVNGNNYLIPIDASLPKNDTWLDESFIDLDTKVAIRLSQSLAAYKIVVMDACRDNPVARTRSSGTRAFARTDQSQNSKGLAFLYSASKGQQAQDGSGQRNSPFTAALVKHLSVPNAIWPVLVDDVTQEVRQATQGQQEVWTEGNALARLVLNPNGQPPLQSQVINRDSSQAAEIADWNSIKTSGRASDYEAYLNKYPNGLFVELAQSKLQPASLQIAQVQIRDKPRLAVDDDTLMRQGMWRDPKTNLVWMRCSLGQVWNGVTCTGEAEVYSFLEARNAGRTLSHSSFGGYSNWVVPHIEDLSSIRYCSTGFENTKEIPAKNWGTKTIDKRCKGVSNKLFGKLERPTIDQSIFPNTQSGSYSGSYWSSSPVASPSRDAWSVDFDDGDSSSYDKSNRFYVRLVRSNQ